MSIRLLSPIFIAGTLSPVDGSTLVLNASQEAELVNRGVAVWVVPPTLPANDGVAVKAKSDPVTGVNALLAGGSRLGLSQIGYRTVLFGDSMVDTCDTPCNPSALSYTPSTGDLQITFNGHQQAVGWTVDFWNRQYPALRYFGSYVVTAVDSANIFHINIGANLPAVPAGALGTAGGCFYRARSWRSAEAFFTWLNMYSGQVFNLIYNGGQSGDQTADCLARLQSYCLALNPDVVICQMPGINDISHNVPLDTIWTNQKSIIDQLCAAVHRAIFLTMTPVAPGEARASVANMARVVKLNRRLKSYLTTRTNGVLFDAHKLVVDPSNASGYALTTMVRTADKLHYSMNGGQRIAKALWTQIGGLFPSNASTLPSSHADSWINGSVAVSSASSDGAVGASIITINSTAHGLLAGEKIKVGGGTPALNALVTVLTAATDSYSFIYPGTIAAGAIAGTIYAGPCNNLFDNPVFATATGGTLFPVAGVGTMAAGSVAPNHTKVQIVTGTPAVAVSVPARADGIGNDVQVIVTAAAAGDTIDIEADYALSVTLFPTIVAAGRSYVFEGSLTLTGVSGSNLTEIRPYLAATVMGSAVQSFATFGYLSGTDLAQDVTDMHFRTAPMLLPVGSVTNFLWSLYLKFGALGTALTVRLGKVNLLELDAG